MDRTRTDAPLVGAATTVQQSEAPSGVRRVARQTLAAGAQVGRYVVERALGAGGMGVVYVAKDPALGRRVALKLLHAGAPSEQLQKEAQALAKLDHRNVVAVYDVGEHEGQAFVAMALVDGKNLRDWLGSPRSVRETLRAIGDAGRGLAAAHAAGLIHRDLKPDNIFVSERGEVLVGDFGLARAAAGDDDGAEGSLVGTPAYMAPEQAAGEPTFASDQFALCATAWEALYGERPFTGATVPELLDAIASGRITEPRDPRRVPRRVRRALERGLAVEPAARWPSVEALLAELARDPAKRHRMIALAAAGTAALGAGAWGLVHATRTPGACELAGDRLATAWSPARAAGVRAQVLAAAPFAITSGESAIGLLDGYAARWQTAWDEMCGASLSAQDYDLRAACLDDRLHALASAADVLRATDRTNARQLYDVAAGLPSLAHCTDLTSLRKVAPPPAGSAARVAEIERALASGDALARAGRYAAADAILQRAKTLADALGYAPLQGQAEQSAIGLLLKQAHFKDARPLAESALNHAIAGGDDELTAVVYTRMGAIAVGLADASRARELQATADAAVRRIGDPADLRARLTVHAAVLPGMTGDYAEAKKRIDAAIPLLEAAHRYTEAAGLYRMHSALLGAFGTEAEARAAYDHEIEIDRELLGAAHPDTADAVVARAGFELAHEHYAEAFADYQVGYATLVAALGADDSATIKAGAELAVVDQLFGRYEQAVPRLRRAAETIEAVEGPQGAASARRALAGALAGAGKLDDAERELARAQAIDDKLEGPYRLADVLQLAQLRVMQDRIREGEQLLDDVQPQLEKLLGADNVAMSDTWVLRARIALSRHQPAAALPWLARVTSGPNLADAKVELFHALESTGDHAGAAAARAEALALIDKIGPAARPDLRDELRAR